MRWLLALLGVVILSIDGWGCTPHRTVCEWAELYRDNLSLDVTLCAANECVRFYEERAAEADLACLRSKP